MSAIARWCFPHRILVVAAWVIVLIGLGALAQGIQSSYGNSPSLPGPGSTTSADVAALHALEAALPRVPDVAAVPPVAARAGTEVIEVIPRTSPAGKATSDLIAVLRGRTILAAEHGTTLWVYVRGITATFADLASFVGAKLTWFLVAISRLIFLLLVAAFRSLLIPATAAVMNLIAAATSLHVLIAFFQWGTIRR